MLVGSRKTGFPILPVTGLCASALKGCLCAIVAVSSFSLVRRLFPVPLLSLSSPPTTFLPCARIQPPEPAAGSPWELVLTLWAFLSNSTAEVDEFLD